MAKANITYHPTCEIVKKTQQCGIGLRWTVLKTGIFLNIFSNLLDKFALISENCIISFYNKNNGFSDF